jgi:hypothetical protein
MLVLSRLSETAMTILELPGDTMIDEEILLLDVANLRHVPDWEHLMEEGTTPALVVGGERRSTPR